MLAIVKYPGGKNGGGAYQKIINQIPSHDTYIEAFAGSAAVARNIRPARQTILIDRNAAAVDALACWIRNSPGAVGITADARSWLASYPWQGGEFVYCDPPYLMETRISRRRLYLCELESEAEHARLLDVLISLPCPVMISGYWSKLYAERLSAWRTLTYEAITRGGKMATEWLWMNYPEPVELHDYRYLGENKQQRQDFKRMQARWRIRLAQMPIQKRRALLAAIKEL